ncbi:MAG TPA: GNAT family N-acetyltransferase [Clostridia bacterium]|nr:GNAT family N-acetyltransferase [Clostridia bacterium]
MIRLLNNEDKQAVLDYICRNDIETSFLYANVTRIGLENDGVTRRCADYFGFFDATGLRGILPFYNLGSCIPHYEAEQAIPLFARLMQERKFEYLLGMAGIVRPIYQIVKDSKKIKVCNESCYFVNRSLRPFKAEGVEFREASEAARDESLLEFLVRVRNIGFHENVSREDALKNLSSDPEEDAVIAVADGRPVAFANIQTYTRSLSQIGSVYTEESERGKGYGKTVVSEVCRRITERGKIPALFARKNNVPAVKAYKALGFEPFDDYLFIELEA